MPGETLYDKVEYVGRPYLATHPDRIKTIGRLYGLEPADPRRARVLELGCSDGGNLLAMAVSLPEASFLGIDAAGTSIESGRELAQAVGASNLELRWADLLELDDAVGSFDYIIAHGVYSWVPETVRRKLLSIVKKSLAPNGIAFISYNAYPGCFPRQMARDIMRFHVRGIDDPETRIAQALNQLSAVAGAQPEGSSYRAALEHELKQLAKAGTSFVFHDALAPDNTPFHFEEFVAQAATVELEFLSEAQFFESYEGATLTGLAEKLPSHDSAGVVRAEQYLDHLKGRSFRQTLLVHKGTRVDRNLDPEHLKDLLFWARFQRATSDETAAESQVEQFVAYSGARVTTNSAVAKATFAVVTEAWPGVIAFGDLLERVLPLANMSAAKTECEQELGALLLRLYASRMVEFRATPPIFTLDIGERPYASPLARQQAQGDGLIVNLRHAQVQLDEPLPRVLLCLLDGKRTRDELLQALSGFATEKSLPLPSEAELEKMLKDLAGHAVLLPS